jgi:hypothetical protein
LRDLKKRAGDFQLGADAEEHQPNSPQTQPRIPDLRPPAGPEQRTEHDRAQGDDADAVTVVRSEPNIRSCREPDVFRTWSSATADEYAWPIDGCRRPARA